MKNDDFKELENIRSLVVDAIAETMDHYGVTPSTGLLYGLMYLHNNPITLDELGQMMSMSKGSMSTGVRKLMENKMVLRVYKPGVRKDLYIAEHDFFKNFVNFFGRKWKQEISVNMNAIKKAELKYKDLLENHQISAEVRKEIESDLQKIKESREYYSFLERLVESCETGEIFDLLQPKKVDDDK